MRKCEAIGCTWDVFGTDKKTKIGYCKNHQYLRTDKSRYRTQRTPIERTPLKSKRVKSEGLVLLYKEIWAERDKVSFISKIDVSKISDTFWLNVFAHVLAKGQGKYPKFKLYKENIVLLTPKEHHLFDHGTKDEREAYASHMIKQGIVVHWNKLYDLIEELKTKYKKDHGN